MVQNEKNFSRKIADLLACKTGHVHLAGVCGVGMAGLAFLLKARGFKVSGCDLVPGQMAEWLKTRGIKVFAGHDAAHISRDVKWVIRSAAVPLESPEIRRAVEMGIPVFARGLVLPELISDFNSIAVGGTHGKTTTTTFITQLLKSAGRHPSWCIGGEAPDLGGVAGFRGKPELESWRRSRYPYRRTGEEKSSPWRGRAPAGSGIWNPGVGVDTLICEQEKRRVRPGGAGLLQSEGELALAQGGAAASKDVIVVEADESDGTLALYRPDIAVVTNIEFDHMEHFESVGAFEECFRKFIKGARQRAVYCADDPRAKALCRGHGKCISYGLGKAAEVRGIQIKQNTDNSEFTVVCGTKKLGKIFLPVPGIHNVLNALAATAVGLEVGLSFALIRKGLARISLPRRRFDLISKEDGVTVISDYAHHPSEIRALVRTAGKLKHSRLLAVFQPHRYTRTLALGPDFPAAFAGVDELVLVPVYEASEKPLKGGSIWDLYEHFRGQKSENRSQVPGLKVSVASSLEQAWAYFRTELRKGDLFLVVGAGDVEKIAGWAGRERSEVRDQKSVVRRWKAEFRKFGTGTRVRFNEPMGKKTSMGVGGAADVYVETGSSRDLAKLIRLAGRRKVPFRIIGGGSNIVVSDLGVRGITARLSGGDFGGIRFENGLVVAGAGVPNAKLLGWLELLGLGGLEFLEGIPGTVGGAVRMNAGAWGQEICRNISWIRCLNMDGRECTVRGKSVKFRYRECQSLSGRILIEAGFKVAGDSPGNIRLVRVDLRQRRDWMRGLRSAGSIFKNPAGKFSGKLIEEAGLKGRRIGGAVVSERHANVIVAQPGASASDVMGLINIIRDEVRERSGVSLDTEVELFE